MDTIMEHGHVAIIGLCVSLGIAIYTDITSHRIPNWLTYSTALFAVLYHSLTRSTDGFIFSLKGLGIGMLPLMPFFVSGVMGAGDVKLMGAVGAAIGPMRVLNAFLYTGIVGGIYALVVLLLHRAQLRAFIHRFWIMSKTVFYTGQIAYVPPSKEEKELKVCYGAAIAIGTMSCLLWEYMGYSV